MRSTLYATLLLSFLSLSLATPSHPRIFRRDDICSENNQVDCDFSCMPADANCCSDGSGTYCLSGLYCNPGGCCPEGELCDTGAGTSTIDNLTGTGSAPTATPISNPEPTGVYPTETIVAVTSVGNAASTGSARTGLSHSSQLYALVLVAARQLVLG
jgi:hypothetical protein